MHPGGEYVMGWGILPGVPHEFLDLALSNLDMASELSIHYGGKRYLSGYITFDTAEKWAAHYGDQWERVKAAKKQFDPDGILGAGSCSTSRPEDLKDSKDLRDFKAFRCPGRPMVLAVLSGLTARDLSDPDRLARAAGRPLEEAGDLDVVALPRPRFPVKPNWSLPLNSTGQPRLLATRPPGR